MPDVPIDRRRLHAPQQDRGVLVAPPPEQVAGLIAENLRARRQFRYDLQGKPLGELSLMARAELLDAARWWTSGYRDISPHPADPQDLLFLAGHQPQMFHPGVWYKNFALGALAARHGAMAVNLIIDGDALSETSLKVPTGSVDRPRAAYVPFDRPEPRIPYELRKIEDRECFAGFGRRVAEKIAPLVADPLVSAYWPLAAACARQTDNLGACLSQSRHQLEGRWGLETLEAPQSWVFSGEAFQWFVAHLLARLPAFRAVYNEAIRRYRQEHGVRSRSHPAPELAQQPPWLEAPFWVFSAEAPRRRRLLSRAAADEIVLSDGADWQAALPLSPEGDAARAVQRLSDLHRRGVRIRPRALVTTLWARLALGDLFIHGIGGAKYDEVTDVLIERFFRLRPPGFLVVSATLHLPIPRPPVTAADVRAVRDQLRAMTYHPEQFLDGPEAAELAATKRRWIETPPGRENARQRCRAIRQINAALQPRLQGRRQLLSQREADLSRHLAADSVLASRDYAYCLYPESTLREFLTATGLGRRG
jgi:hypothetical protein